MCEGRSQCVCRAESVCVCVSLYLPSVNHTIESMEQLYTWHAVGRGSGVEVHYNIVINNKTVHHRENIASESVCE